jgi:hypothetical protein
VSIPINFQSQSGVCLFIANTTREFGILRLETLQDAMNARQREIVRRVEGLFALADSIGARFMQARAQMDQPMPTLLDRAWTHSLPARSSCALSLREIRLARSLRARLKGEL